MDVIGELSVSRADTRRDWQEGRGGGTTSGFLRASVARGRFCCLFHFVCLLIFLKLFAFVPPPPLRQYEHSARVLPAKANAPAAARAVSPARSPGGRRRVCPSSEALSPERNPKRHIKVLLCHVALSLPCNSSSIHYSF